MAKKSFALALSLAAIALPTAPALAATPIDASTGRGVNPGGIDGNWVIGGPLGVGPNAFVSSNVPGTWSGGASNPLSTGGARWISTVNNATSGPGNLPVGLYTFATKITLPNITTISKLILSGKFWADNQVTSVTLNGATIFSSTFTPGSSPELFRDTAFQTFNFSNFSDQGLLNLGGDNDLVFTLANGGTSASPAGLKAEVTGLLSAVPEPGTWMLMVLGFGAIGFSMRFRKKDQARVQFA